MTNDHMLSLKNYIVMTLIMLVIFFLFMFTGAARELLNNSSTNDYAGLDGHDIKAEDIYTVNEENDKAELVYIGNDDEIYYQIKEYARYFRKDIRRLSEISLLDTTTLGTQALNTKTIVIEGKDLKSSDIDTLEAINSVGIDIVFVNLPDSDFLVENSKIKDFLGIEKVHTDSSSMTGMEIYSGFLLGGDMIYEAHNEKEEKQQDLDLTLPWYEAGSATKLYMVGLFGDDTDVDNEDLPAIVWKKRQGDGNIYAVNGDFMRDETAIGFMCTFAYESADMMLYPIVNATSIAAVDYPSAANENEGRLQQLYSRDALALQRDLIWSGLSSILAGTNGPVTCMVSPRIDDSTAAGVNTEDLAYMMKLVKERQAESGLCLSDYSSLDVKTSLEEDKKLLKKATPDYAFQSIYIGAHDVSEVTEALNDTGLDSVKALLAARNEDESQAMLYFEGEDNLVMTETNAATSHTFSEDIRMRSVYTALGYSTIVADMGRLIYPEDSDDEWQEYYDKFSSYINTYYKPFSSFDDTTLSVASRRARVYLNSDFDVTMGEGIMRLRLKKENDGNTFLFRTHGLNIKQITGASYEKIEDGAYIIRLENKEATISLKNVSEKLLIN